MKIEENKYHNFEPKIMIYLKPYYTLIATNINGRKHISLKYVN